VDDNGAECAPNTPGELWIRPADGSPPVVEYYNNPEASAEKTAGGWLHMGDVVTMDQDGWVFFLYRKGGGIRRNGEFVNAAFLEKCMAEHPDVADVAVFGVPAKSGAPGEMDLVAAIVADMGRRIDVRRVFDWCRSRVEPNLVPSHLMVLPELPKTASEKVQPRVLVEMFNVGAYPIDSERLPNTTQPTGDQT
jgi:carnitine-CoA ligase